MSEDEEFAGVVRDLRGLYSAELARAHGEPDLRIRRRGVRSKAEVPFALLAVGVVAIVSVAFLKDRIAPVEVPATPNSAAQVVPATPAPQRNDSAGPIATPLPTAEVPSPNPTESATNGASGPFPAQIDGEPVLTGADALERATNGDDQPFLVGGWIVYVTGDCFEDCFSGFLLRLAPRGSAFDQFIGLRLPQPFNVGSTPVVLQVRRDDESSSCSPGPDCLASVAVDSTIWTGPLY